jgi:hypothetical protein
MADKVTLRIQPLFPVQEISRLPPTARCLLTQASPDKASLCR